MPYCYGSRWCCYILWLGIALTSPGNCLAADEQEEAICRAVERVKPSLVTLWFGDDPKSHVTGTFISSDGLILTCAHLGKETGANVEVQTADGKTHTGVVLAKSSERGKWGNDLALVQLANKGPWPTVHLESGSPEELMIVLGYPESGLLSQPGKLPPLFVRVGRQAAFDKSNLKGMIRTTMRGLGGDSGGPVLNLSGSLIGVITNGDAGGSV